MVCETMGTLSIGILRVGNLLMSSFVGVEVHSLTAKQGLDFEPSRAKQIQFDPGVSQVSVVGLFHFLSCASYFVSLSWHCNVIAFTGK